MSTKTALLDSLMEKYGYDAIAMIPSPNMSWLTGQAKSQGERPTTIIYRPGKTAALIIAGFEVDAAPAMDIPVEIFRFTDGYLDIPEGPGLGLDIDEDKIKEVAKEGLYWTNPAWKNYDGTIAEW